jgi:hypothetical protein
MKNAPTLADAAIGDSFRPRSMITPALARRDRRGQALFP